jgi:hypothetical protein
MVSNSLRRGIPVTVQTAGSRHVRSWEQSGRNCVGRRRFGRSLRQDLELRRDGPNAARRAAA